MKKKHNLTFCGKITNLASQKKVTHQVLPSVSITPKSMTYRDTAYLKSVSNFSDSGDDPIGDSLQNKVVTI